MSHPFSLTRRFQAAILYNLRARHMTGKPYTRVGDLIIAVNPFRWMPELYSEDNRTKYVERLIFSGEFGVFNV